MIFIRCFMQWHLINVLFLWLWALAVSHLHLFSTNKIVHIEKKCHHWEKPYKVHLCYWAPKLTSLCMALSVAEPITQTVSDLCRFCSSWVIVACVVGPWCKCYVAVFSWQKLDQFKITACVWVCHSKCIHSTYVQQTWIIIMQGNVICLNYGYTLLNIAEWY